MLLPSHMSRVPGQGSCTASHCCCLHRHTLPCATFRSLSHTAGVSKSVMGPCTASHCCCPSSPHSAMCHFQV
ncbi:unnamed protein product, partial [Staurois parvus]